MNMGIHSFKINILLFSKPLNSEINYTNLLWMDMMMRKYLTEHSLVHWEAYWSLEKIVSQPQQQNLGCFHLVAAEVD